MSKISIYFIFLIILLLSTMANATNIKERWHWHDKVFKNYGVNQGLPQGIISAICEDEIGFIWLVTREGLVRFDGTNFKHVPTIIKGVEFTITSMITDNEGMIWMSTNKGLIRFNPISRLFKLIDIRSEPTLSLGTLSIIDRVDTSFLWIASDERVLRLNTKTLSTEVFFENQFISTPNLRIFSILNTENNITWLGTSHGLFYKKDNENSFTMFDLSNYLPDNSRISALLQTSDKHIIVATPRSGILRINTKLQVSKPIIPDFSQEWIYSLEEISPGVLWLGTYGAGVIELDFENQNSERIKHNRLLYSSLVYDEIWKIYRSKNGLVWLATDNGLSIYNPNQKGIKTLFGNAGRDKDLSDTNVKSLAEDSEGNIWLGLQSKGVDIVNPLSGLLKNIGVNEKEPTTSLPGGAIETLKLQSSGRSFIGSNWGIYQHWQSRFQRLKTDKRNTDTYTGALLVDSNYLWAGGTDGLWRFTLAADQLTSAKHISTIDNKFTSERITVIGETPGNELLIGTWSGLNWINKEGNITYQLSKSTSLLSESFISSFFYDKNDRLWVGTEGAGIFIAQDKNHPSKFTQINKKQGLSSNVIRAMQQDNQGRVWVSGLAGIDVIDIDSFEVTPSSTQAGVLVSPYFRQAAIQTTSGDILFGGSGGLTIIKPKLWQTDDHFSPLVLIKSTIGGQEYTNPLLKQSIKSPLIVSANKNKISVEFTTLDFINSKSIKYRYRLLGLNNDWNIIDSKHSVAAYTTLPPGKYQLEIQNSNRFGQWNSKSHVLYLQVLPYWYQTFVAKAIFILLTLAIIVMAIRFRTNRLNKRKLALEEQVRLRTLSLHETTKALEKKSEELIQLSVTDPLTGINNRLFLEHNMPTEIAMTSRKYHDLAPDNYSIKDADLIFFLIDIDHFKKVNDLYGHHAGDLVLIEFTERLKSLARESDYLVRWGGEEFVFVVRETSRELAAQLAHRICQQVKQKPFIINEDTKLSLTCSIGFVPFPFCCHNPNVTTWLNCIDIADKALYTAKHAGRNSWVGTTLKKDYSVKNMTIDVFNLPINIVNLESNLEQFKINETWKQTKIL